MKPGTYTLSIELETPRVVSFGAAGERHLSSGWYAYTGSAFGPGGLSRISRHKDVDSGDNDTPHWHIDFLLSLESASIRSVKALAEKRVECAIARTIDGEWIEGIGATDCACPSHLHYRADKSELHEVIRDAYQAVRKNVH